eukprot:Gb_26097 [translate_table: standard]
MLGRQSLCIRMADAEMPVGLSDPSKMEEHIEGVEAEEKEIVDSGDVIERPIDTSNTHPLEPSSTFWFDNPNGKSKQATWGNSLRPVCTFSTVEDFWWTETFCLKDFPSLVCVRIGVFSRGLYSLVPAVKYLLCSRFGAYVAWLYRYPPMLGRQSLCIRMADAEMPVGLSDPSKMEEHIEGVEAEEKEIVDSGDVIERPIDTSNTHPLEPSSTFWFDNPNGKSKQATWGNSLRPVCTFSTVEDFWWQSNLSVTED